MLAYLRGPTLSIVQAFATLSVGLIISMIYIWKVGLVGLGKYLSNLCLQLILTTWKIACVPFLMSTGYIRLVRSLGPSSLVRVLNPFSLSASSFSKINRTRKFTMHLLNLHAKLLHPSAPSSL